MNKLAKCRLLSYVCLLHLCVVPSLSWPQELFSSWYQTVTQHIEGAKFLGLFCQNYKNSEGCHFNKDFTTTTFPFLLISEIKFLTITPNPTIEKFSAIKQVTSPIKVISDVGSYLNLGGQIVIDFYLCFCPLQNLDGQLSTLPTHLLHPWL